nr:unnamed protein product [Meloidogyne enterolobii]
MQLDLFNNAFFQNNLDIALLQNNQFFGGIGPSYSANGQIDFFEQRIKMNNLNAWDVLHIVNTYFYQPAMAAVDQIRTFIMIAFTNLTARVNGIDARISGMETRLSRLERLERARSATVPYGGGAAGGGNGAGGAAAPGDGNGFGGAVAPAAAVGIVGGGEDAVSPASSGAASVDILN